MKEYYLPEDLRMESGGVNDIGWVWDTGGGQRRLRGTRWIMSLFCSLNRDPEDVNNYAGDRGGAKRAETKL